MPLIEIYVLQQRANILFTEACKFDGIPENVGIAVFSTRNPFKSEYDRVFAKVGRLTEKRIREISA